MSELIQRIDNDLIVAMKSGNDLARDTLRMVRTGLKNRQIEKGSELSDEDVVTVLRKEMKSREEAATQYSQAGRAEAAAKEEAEKAVITKYLPAEMSDEELGKIVDEAIRVTGASNAADMGKVMKEVMGKVAGRVEGGKVSGVVRSKLGER